MKKSFLLLAILCLSTLSLFAKKTVKATIITRKDSFIVDLIIQYRGDRGFRHNIRMDKKGALNEQELTGHLRNITAGLQNGITYLNEKGKKVKISPEDAKEIKFQLDEQEYHFYSKKVEYTRGKQKTYFLPLVIDGKLRVYAYEMVHSNPGAGMGGDYFTYYVEKNGRGELKKIRMIAIRKDLRSKVSDCRELTEKMDDLKYCLANNFGFFEMVQYYNEHCAQ